MNNLLAYGDKMLDRLVPRRTAAACQKPSVCKFVKRGCSGPYCYYYFQWLNTCFVEKTNQSCGVAPLRNFQGCC